MPQAKDLATDIEALLARSARGEPLPDDPASTMQQALAESVLKDNIAASVKRLFRDRAKTWDRLAEKKLYMSEIGHPCSRKVWYSFHAPTLAEPMQGHTLLKFLVGDLIEGILLYLAQLAGHDVKRQQERAILKVDDWEVSGRIDAEIDGAIVDTKSASKFSFEKFKDGLNDGNDAFGYRAQLDGYAAALKSDEAGFLVSNKETGKLLYAPHKVETEGLDDHVRKLAKAIEQDAPPPRAFEAIPDGKSGNLKLGPNCSYCDYKHECWPGLRGFVYAKGPIWLTEVRRVPDVPEITRGETEEDE